MAVRMEADSLRVGLVPVGSTYVTGRRDDAEFFKALGRVEWEVGITGEDVVTFMGTSVTVGLEVDSPSSLTWSRSGVRPWRSDWTMTDSSNSSTGWNWRPASPVRSWSRS